MDNIVGYRPFASVIRSPRLSDSEGLRDVPDLGDIFENIAYSERPNDLDLIHLRETV